MLACRTAGADARGVRYTFADMNISVAEGARFEFASDQSLLVYFDQPKEEGPAPDRLGISSARPLQRHITLQANESVRRLPRLLELEAVAGIRNFPPADSLLLGKFDGVRMGHDSVDRAP